MVIMRLHKFAVVFMVMVLTVLAMNSEDVPVVHAEERFGDFEYRLNDDGTATLTRYNGMNKALVIPRSLGEVTVTHISDHFDTHYTLNSVVFPDSIIRIGSQAFYDHNLTAVELPSSLESIGLRTFANNPNLKAITVAVGNMNYKDIDGKALYTLDGEVLVQGTNSGIIAAGTSIIGEYAFEGMDLTSIVLPDCLESIENHAFRMNKLIEIILPSSVKKVGTTAFEINSLTKVALSADLEEVNLGAFRSNPLEQITIPEGNPFFKDIDGKGLYTLDGDILIQGTLNGDIHHGTKTIQQLAFSGLGLTEVELPSSLERIELHAFRSNSLEKIIISDKVKYISDYAFSGNNELRDVTIFGSPELEGDRVFDAVPDLVIKGYIGTSAERYAIENEIDFAGDKTQAQVSFHPIGRDGVNGITSIEVKADHYDTERGLTYRWSQEKTVPADSEEWHVLTNGAVLDNPDPAEDWYLHVRAIGLLGNVVDRRSDSLKVVFFGGYGTEAQPYEIETAEQLDAVRNYLDKYFVLTKDIDLTDFLHDKPEGWAALGGDIYAGPFKGEFDGNGFVISNLRINRDTGDQGLFSMNEGVIINLGLTAIDVSGNQNAGGLVGRNNAGGLIENVYASMSVNGDEGIGVIKGVNVGILAGKNDGTIKNSYTSGNLRAISSRAGLLTGSNSGTIFNGYTRGNLSVDASATVGGLVGDNTLAGPIANAYTSGNVSGVNERVGALIGLTTSRDNNNISRSYWNQTINTKGIGGTGLTDGAAGLTVDEMKILSSFEEFEDREETWAIIEGVDFPYLKHSAVLTLTELEDIHLNFVQFEAVRLSGEIFSTHPLQPFKLHAVLSKEENGETTKIAEADFDERIWSGRFTDLELPELIQASLSEAGQGRYTLWIYATYAAQGTAAIPLAFTFEPIELLESPKLQSALPGDEQVTLIWNDVDDADHYHVYQKEGDSAPADADRWIRIGEALIDTSYQATGLTNGTTYTFAVAAVRGGMESDFSNLLSATPQDPPSDNAQLNMIYINDEELAGFQPEALGYTLDVPYENDKVTVTAAVYDPSASYVIRHNGREISEGKLNLEVGSNTIEIIVTAENGDDYSTYTLAINRAGSIPSWPVNRNLSIEDITQTSIKLAWPAAEDGQGVTGYRIDVDDGSGSQQRIIVDGQVHVQRITNLIPNTTYTFVITAFNEAGLESEGLSVRARTLTAENNENEDNEDNEENEENHEDHENRYYYVPSSNKRLRELTLSTGELQPVWSQNRTEYQVEVEHGVQKLSVTPTAEHALASITVNGISVRSGQASSFIDLIEGDNEIIVQVTAENGTKQTYIMTVTRAYASHPIEEPAEVCKQEDVHRFNDLEGHWAAPLIQRSFCEEITMGYSDGTFKPDELLTRAEFTVMLANTLTWEGSEAEFEFTDQEHIQHWAMQAIAQAVQHGVISGYDDGSIRPNVSITRAEVSMMIARSLDLSIDVHNITPFADDAHIPLWAKGAVEAVHRLGIIVGRGDNSFVPNAPTTRAEAAVMLLRMKESLLE